MPDLDAHGVTVTALPGWEGRIFVRPAHGTVGARTADGAPAPEGERTLPVVHLATIALPEGVADYGDPAVEDLGPHDALIVLKEFDPSEAGTALFATEGVPRVLDPDAFDSGMLQRTLQGQAGYQVFCREGGRAFCLYVVLGAGVNRDEVVAYVNAVLATLRVEPLTGPVAPETTTTTTPLGTALQVVRATTELATFAALVDQAGLTDRLGGVDPVTVLAPTDAAFGAFEDLDAVRADGDRLRALVEHHLLPVALEVQAIDQTQDETTLAGTVVQLRRTGDTLEVSGVVAASELSASNGFVQLLDGVLTPPAP